MSDMAHKELQERILFMALAPRELVSSPWGNYLRQKRLQTRAAKSHYKGDWSYSQPDFCKWINSHLPEGTKPISTHTYIDWENGRTQPRQRYVDIVRNILETQPLPVAKGEDGDE